MLPPTLFSVFHRCRCWLSISQISGGSGASGFELTCFLIGEVGQSPGSLGGSGCAGSVAASGGCMAGPGFCVVLASGAGCAGSESGKHENRGRKSWKIEDFLGAMAAIEDLLFYGSYVKR